MTNRSTIMLDRLPDKLKRTMPQRAHRIMSSSMFNSFVISWCHSFDDFGINLVQYF